MSLEWLEKHTKIAAQGIDAAVLDMFKSLGNPTHMQVLASISEKPQRFKELECTLDMHPQTLSRNLRDLQEHRLATKADDKYIATAFGTHILVIARDLSKKAAQK